MVYTIATGNHNKRTQFMKYLENRVIFEKFDFDEPDSNNHSLIVAYKATQIYNRYRKTIERFNRKVCVEDSILIVNGIPITKIKDYIIENRMNELVNSEASFVVKIGYYYSGCIYIFTGEIKGTLIDTPRGNSNFGFDNWFLVDGTDKTLGEMYANEKDEYNPRRIACDNLLKGEWSEVHKPIFEWKGEFQKY